MTNPTVVQAAFTSSGGSLPQPVFGSSVTAGNTLVAVAMGAPNGISGYPNAGANGWTRVTGINGSGNDVEVQIYTRTALSGDGTTPPGVTSATFNTGSSTVWMWEVTPAVTVDKSDAENAISSGGGSTASLTSTNANELGLCAAGSWFASTTPTVTGAGWSTDGTETSGQVTGAMAHIAVPTASTSVSATIGASGDVASAVGFVLMTTAVAPGETGTITQTLGATFSQALTGSIPNEFGPIAQTLGAFSQSVGGNDSTPGKGAVYFTTFGG